VLDGELVSHGGLNCELPGASRSRPHAFDAVASIADLDRGMWIGLAARALEGVEPCRIECETHSCHDDGSCRVTLTVTAD
jgi:hypothetical protein